MKKTSDNFSSDPFFIVSKPRSGSTFLAYTLSKLPEIGIAPESNFVKFVWDFSKTGKTKIETKEQLKELLSVIYTESKFANWWNLSKDELLEDLKEDLPLSAGDICKFIIFKFCRINYPSTRIWGMKKGGWYLFNIENLIKLFPAAKFIHIVRDGRAVFASSKKAMHSEKGIPFESDPLSSACEWKKIINEMERYKDSSFMMEIRYENLINDSVKVVKNILPFLEINKNFDLYDILRDDHKNILVNQFNEHLHFNIERPPKPELINKWRGELTKEEIQSFEKEAGDILIKKGYTLIY